jgi:hypothetical protein
MVEFSHIRRATLHGGALVSGDQFRKYRLRLGRSGLLTRNQKWALDALLPVTTNGLVDPEEWAARLEAERKLPQGFTTASQLVECYRTGQTVLESISIDSLDMDLGKTALKTRQPSEDDENSRRARRTTSWWTRN